MSRKEIEKLIKANKFSKNVRCFGDDKLRDLMEEIYCDGIKDGLELAQFRLSLLSGIPSSLAERYLDENMEQIRTGLRLCEEYEASD